MFPFFARDPLSQLHFFLRGILHLFFLAVLHFGAIFSYIEKMCFGRDFAFLPLKHHFRQFCPVNIINAKVSIKKDHLYVKVVLRRHHSSVYVQWFGRDARTKPFLHLSFIYREISLSYLVNIAPFNIRTKIGSNSGTGLPILMKLGLNFFF